VISFVAGLFGLVIGSFLNVVIHRVPLRQSIMWPSSRCPSCGERIKSFDNLPVLSYLILRGWCRNCKERISPRYPLVEVLTGLLFALAGIFTLFLGPEVREWYWRLIGVA
jgi:leader peptidase (prepilin peptidase)/N-methyltransferase